MLIHMLCVPIGVGHLSNYLLLYGNMYCYSQQGQESIKSTIKLIIFDNTQRTEMGKEEERRNTNTFCLSHDFFYEM